MIDKNYQEGSLINPIEDVAFDEAGHVVLARILGRHINNVIYRRNVNNEYNGESDYNEISSPPFIDSNIPYDEIGIAQPDGISDRLTIKCGGKVSLILFCRDKGIREDLATFGLGDCREILLRLKHSGLSKQQRKQELRELEARALQILGYPPCKDALDTMARSFLEELHVAIKQNLKFFVIDGERIQERIAQSFLVSKLASEIRKWPVEQQEAFINELCAKIDDTPHAAEEDTQK
jgi:hypothetical protein